MTDTDDLKAVFERLTQAYSSGNLEAFAEHFDEEATIYTPLSPFSVNGRVAVKHFYQALAANAESITTTRISNEFRVVGTTGLVWGYTTFIIKLKDAPVRMLFIRQTWTFAESGGKWLVVAAHYSRLPASD
jgi:uncharacterized protein (TIGR02246 family)